MTWTPPLLLSLLVALFVLALSHKVTEGAAVPDDKSGTKMAGPQGATKRIFMPESDASHFFKHRSRRSVKSQDEIYAEQRQRLAANEHHREYKEEQRNEYENYVEEVRDEQDERTRETTEQWREFHYDGFYPYYQYPRHHV